MHKEGQVAHSSMWEFGREAHRQQRLGSLHRSKTQLTSRLLLQILEVLRVWALQLQKRGNRSRKQEHARGLEGVCVCARLLLRETGP